MKKILSIVCILLLLAATSNLIVNIHFCGGEISSIDFFGKSKNCGSCDSKNTSGKPSINSKSCCKNLVATITTDDSTTSTFYFQTEQITTAVIPVIFTYASLLVSLFAINASAKVVHNETSTFKVYGNCEMCKKRIETALLKNQNIKKATWDVKTKMLTVVYDPHMISLDTIHKIVADAGYDTEKVRASDAAYNKLPGCCKYDRPMKM